MTRSLLSLRAAVAVAAAFALLLTACGGDAIDAGPVQGDAPGTEEPATDEPADDAPVPDDATDAPGEPDDVSPEPEPAPVTDEDADTSLVRLYYLAPGGETPVRAGPFLVSVQREIPSTPRIALATLRELVAGPTDADQALIPGISSAVPADTLVLGVTIDDRVATVDLSREFEAGGGSLSMFGRLAQLVYTVTQFPTVDEVELTLDGQPVSVFSGEGIMLDGAMSRDDYVDLLPLIFVDQPAAGATIRDGARMTGMAAVFEATFQYRLQAADGTVLAETFAMTDEGMGWGTFDLDLHFSIDEVQPGTLTVWMDSAEDGSPLGERVTPVVLAP